MITILTKKQALQAMLDGKEVMGFLACDITTQGEPDPLPGDTGIKTGVYKSHSVNDAFDTYAFFIADIEPEENEPGKKDKSKKHGKMR